jgi:4-hydroxybenzoate polyprenyltransferase
MTSLLRLLAFARERFPLRVYGTYAVLWVPALTGSLALAQPNIRRWVLGPYVVAEIVSVLATLLFIRLVDEQKDLDYDRKYHPGRPLPRGDVSSAELRWAAAFCAAGIIAVNLPISGWLALWSAVNLTYICLLMAIERALPGLGDRLFVNLAISYPGQLMISGYVWLALLLHAEVSPTWQAIPVIVIFAAVFLHFEFARKTSWNRHAEPGFYSNAVGGRGAATLAICSAAVAALLAALTFRPWTAAGIAAFAAWLPFSAAAFVWIGGRRFLSRAAPAWPAASAMGFLAWFYLGLLAQSLAVQDVGWSW